MKSGMATCSMSAPALFTAIACMVRMSPSNGHRFNPNKLLIDPYAREFVGELKWDHALFGYTIGAEGDDLTFDERDSAPFMPKCVVADSNFDWQQSASPHRAVGSHHHL